MQNTVYIFDFDSTFIQDESLDILADISLANNPNRQQIIEDIQRITEMSMEGQYSIPEALSERIGLLKISQTDINAAIEHCRKRITPSFKRNQNFFSDNRDKIYIISGGFREIIWPIVKEFGLHKHHVFANRFFYDMDGHIVDFDRHNLLALDKGKVGVLQKIKLPGDIIVIGDGYNDYEIKASGIAKSFYAFCENVYRENVVKNADAVINDLDGFFLGQGIQTKPNVNKKVLLLESPHNLVKDNFTNLGYEVKSVTGSLDEDELIAACQDVNILGIRSKTNISQNVLAACNNLEAIGAFCIGTNQIDLSAATNLGIAVFNAPFSNTRSVVELCVGEMIMLVRQAYAASLKLHHKKWHKSSTNSYEVRGKTLGIIGYGNIGSQLSVLAESLGLNVIYYDIADKLALGNACAKDSMQQVLAQSDIITIHVDGREENKNLISTQEFEIMKDGVVFLNMSRGFVVDLNALIKNLENNKISGCGIDVFPTEPKEKQADFEHKLQKYNNVILTPHIGGSTIEAQQNIGEAVSKSIRAFVQDGNSYSSVNFPQISVPELTAFRRIVHIHANVPGVLAQINKIFANSDSNIEGQYLKTNEQIGYVVTDIDKELSRDDYKALCEIENTIKVKEL